MKDLLPAGWLSTSLKEITEKIGSGATPKGGESSYKNEGTPLIRSKNIIFFGFKNEGLAFIDEEQARALDNATVRARDVLLNITGASIGRVTIAPSWADNARVNQHVCIVRTHTLITPEYISAYLSSPIIQGMIGEENYGVTRQALTKKQVEEIEVPIPPINEQRRILNKLDTTLAAVEACKQKLINAAETIQRFRQSVLAAAVSGELTREWREERGIKMEWLQTTIDSIATVGTGSTPLRSNSSFYARQGIPWVTSSATSEEFIESSEEFVTQSGIESARLKTYPIGTLLVAMYGEGKTRGQVSELQIEATINQACASIHSFKEDYLKDFTKLALKANYLNMRKLAEGGNQPNLNLKKIKKFPIGIPSREEAIKASEIVNELFMYSKSIEDRIEYALQVTEDMSASLLAKAFRGELVSQDPNDEPASDLLRRIKAQREAEAVIKKPAKRGRKKRAALEEKAF